MQCIPTISSFYAIFAYQPAHSPVMAMACRRQVVPAGDWNHPTQSVTSQFQQSCRIEISRYDGTGSLPSPPSSTLRHHVISPNLRTTSIRH
jgi:hypothetical protein